MGESELSVAPRDRAALTAQTRGRSALVCLLLVLGTLGLYSPVRHHGFIAFDDAEYVAENRRVQAGLTVAGAKWAFATGHSSNWHPLTWLSHMLDVELFGAGPKAPHVVNVMLHAANALLIFLLLQRFTGWFWPSVAVAGLFAVQPLRVESVAWLSERKDVLSGFFFLLTWWAYGRYAEARGRKSDWKARYGIALFFFACGLMSKPMLVTLPCVLLLFDYWPLQRLKRWSVREAAPLLGEKLPFFALAIGSSVVTFLVQKAGGAVRSLDTFTLGQRIENAIVAYVRYLGKTIWPSELAIFYPHPGNWPAMTVLVAAGVLAALSFAVVKLRARAPFALVGWLWFLGMMVPTIGLVQVGEHSLADRYTYLPAIGLLMGVAGSASVVAARWPALRVTLAAGATIAIVGYAWATSRYLRHWRDSETLFAHTLAVTQRNHVAHNSLGLTLLEQRRWDEAIAHFEKAIAIRPGYAEAHNNLGTAWQEKGRVDLAAEQFRKAIEARPALAMARYNLGTLLLQTGQVDEAIVHLERAAALRPDDALNHINLGSAFLQSGRLEAAIGSYRRAIEAQPDSADAYCNLGNALRQKGDEEEALGHFRTALKLQPKHANAHFFLGEAALARGQNERAIEHLGAMIAVQPEDAEARHLLGFALLQAGRPREAILQFEAALKLQPNFAGTLSNYAWALATCADDAVRDGAKAVALAQRASELSGGREPAILRTLAAAYAASRRFSEAIDTAQRALQIARQQSDAPLAESLARHLELYQAGTPVREPANREPTL